MRFFLERCLPLKLKAPPLNAKEGVVAIEELQLAYEWLSRVSQLSHAQARTTAQSATDRDGRLI